ncbi:hypothetical protein [Streptomyces malaysiensis]
MKTNLGHLEPASGMAGAAPGRCPQPASASRASAARCSAC